MSLKESTKELRSSAEALLESSDIAVETSSATQQWLALAISSLKEVEKLPSLAESKAEIKKVRKSLQAELLQDGEGEENTTTVTSSDGKKRAREGENTYLGQYETTDAFDTNEKKKMKFSRLMGGAKIAAEGRYTTHDAVAQSKSVYAKMEKDLEEQYTSGLTHKGKKGLGA
ncbi:hypothetical protein AGDE_05383 [Angomonas deanei]|uniref:Small acidic protein n=1 Tax=Angomonas deanei TaxID=59799 RepID=A0A7G2BZI7_9TRYP|nr:hypothetical protein AGDE_05383 [Angomonas deanei]CAD2212870.1 Small acidic protein family, putative [Angomonas deanei]|eukprot:EPY38546.1 hypothetical protein AGDE_05383 [Angomonas deanei]